MPVGVPDNGHGYHQLVRRVRVVRAEMGFRMECSPAFDYARVEHETEVTTEGAAFRTPARATNVLARRRPGHP